MITPIIINQNEEVCPNCGKPEEIIEVCKHCGHEYEYESLSVKEKIIFALFVIVFIWVMITLFEWLFFNFDNESLFEIIKSQYDWITSLRIV